ncbi:MAG: cbb3-type cytochrome c oxidase N-terminal domain-containing protein [Schleiferiaceae bacterium]|nr:cbb3-type cytochrome c oxidase N-terminal domain-containing protein [Schleiferiaceae bacterium]
MKKLNRILLVFVLLLMAGSIGIANLKQQSAADFLSDPVNWLVGAAVVFLLIGFLATYQALDAMKYMLAKKNGTLPAEAEATEEEAEEESEEDFLQRIMHKITDATPVEQEEEVATDHNYDGIRELDNNLPPWWLAGFYISILFAVVYLLRYHVFDSAPLQKEEFKMEMAAAEKQKEAYLAKAANLVDETNVTPVSAEKRLLAGKAIFDAKCAVCHQKDGGGGVGPNLTDPYWLHGASIKDVFSTIKYGVPAKGMVPWKDQLSPKEMQDVASYVLTLRGTDPADPKEPQGEKVNYEELGTQDAAADSTAAPTDSAAATASL